jgi:CubicO group peptidase (beta-lactamase class C family)
MNAFEPARSILAGAVGARVFPGAVAEVGSGAGVAWRQALGTLTFDDGTLASDGTWFDLASLTKPIATTTVCMAGCAGGWLDLEERLTSMFPEWAGPDRASVTVRDLLEHASGLPARLVDPPPVTRREFAHEICGMRLEYPPRTRSIYSDLGFILLGFLLAARGGAPLDALFAAIQAAAGDADAPELRFGPVPAAAPTEPMPEDLRRGRRLNGEVHDNYAAALGGVAGHAGLFGTSGAVGAFARRVLRAARGEGSMPPPWTPDLVALFTRRSAVPGSSRALGWDTMLPTSSCGTRMSAAAFGHVGFTGTSLWIDPARDRYYVLLTNRACGGGTIEAMRGVRRAFHDALASA